MNQTKRAPHLWRRGWPLLLLTALVAIFFWRVVLLGHVLVPADLLEAFWPWNAVLPASLGTHNQYISDVVDSQYPARAVAVHLLRSGQWPLWDPYTSAGRPLATQPIYALSFPLSFVLLLLPLDWGFTALAMLRVFIAGAATFAFLRELKLGRSAAILGGIVFAFNGFLVVWLNATAGRTLAMAPLVFWTGARLLRRPNMKNAALLALSVATLISAGFLAVALYVLYALAAYVAFRAATELWSSRRWRDVAQKLALCGLSILIGITLVAPMLWSFLDHMDRTSYDESREGSGTSFERTTHLIRYLIPDYYGRPQTRDDYDTYPEHTGYVGILPLFLAALALALARRRKTVWFFAGLGGLALGMVYGAPFNRLIALLPGLGINSPTRMRSIVAFCVAVLAALGLDSLQRQAPARHRRTVWVVLGTLVVAQLTVIGTTERVWTLHTSGATAIDGWLWQALGLDRLQRPLFTRTLWLLWQQEKLHHPLFERALFYALWLLTSVALLAAWAKGFLSRRALCIGAVLLVSLDLLGWGASYNRPIPPDLVFPSTPGIEFLQSDPELFRMTGLDLVFLPNTPSVYGLQSIAGHDPLAPDRYRQALRRIDPNARFGVRGTWLQLSVETTDFSSPLLDLLNVKYLADEPGAPHDDRITADGTWVRAYEGPDLTIYENAEVLPRALLVSQAEVVADPAVILDRLASGELDPRRLALVEETLPHPLSGIEGSHPQPEIVTYEATRVVVRAQTPEPALLVLGEMDAPGWQATLDGQPADVYRANYLFRGVFLPAGSHEVTFTYRPRPYLLGQVVRLGGVLVLVLGWVWERWRRRAAGEEGRDA